MPTSISAFASKDLLRVLARLQGLDKEMVKQVNAATKAAALPIWRDTLAQSSDSRMEVKVLSGSAAVLASSSNVKLRSGHTSKRLSGGGRVFELAPAVEFGRNPNAQTAVKSSRGMTFKRRSGARFKQRNRSGYVVHPAAQNAIPRIASLWVQTVYRTIAEAFE